MPAGELLQQIAALAGPAPRRAAAADALAAELGCDALFVFVSDEALGALLPAPGFRQTRPGGEGWRKLLAACRDDCVVAETVGYPDARTPRSAVGWAVRGQAAFVFIGAPRAVDASERVVLGLVVDVLRAEQAAMVATGDAAAARQEVRHARDLTTALDATRAELERAFSDARNARGEAEAANRAKDEFLAMLGHELRNPLAPIVTALELLKQGRGSDHEYGIMERQLRHVIRLVDDLLDVSRITRGTVELELVPVDLADIIAGAVEMARPLIDERRHTLTVNVAKGPLRVQGDAARLAQVFANLLTNAARYTPPFGELSLIAEPLGESVVVRVRDNGEGIDPAVISDIFDLFVQGPRESDRSKGGLGLGLAIVRSMVEMHGGTVRAESAGTGQGSEFLVRLPALAPEARTAVPPAERPGGPALPPKALRILLVDDNVDAAELLGIFLRRRGHEVWTAEDGQAALVLAEEQTMDVALLDIGLPGMDGYELAKRLRERPSVSRLRIVALTGYGTGSDRAQSAAAGFDEHLVKPVDPRALGELIEAELPATVAV